MRATTSDHGITLLAVAGSWVVVLGWDLAEAEIRGAGILGFAVRRTRASDGEVVWLSGLKTFEGAMPDPGAGVPVSTLRHPLQTFQWSDFTATPGETYTYRLAAMTGAPGAITEHAHVEVTVTTEPVDGGRHAIFFNRGSIASQEYARRFQNRPPSEVGKAARDWLSRGLLESLEAFIDQAGAGDSLHGAFFEFKNRRIYTKLHAAKDRGVAIRVLYDGDSQLESNRLALQGSRIIRTTKPRTRSGRYAHNKFLVFSRAGQPEEVWTGSTNLTENGIFGHSNNAHLVRDGAIAQQYLDYWTLLDSDQTRKPTAVAATAMSAAPTPIAAGDTVVVFSPRTDFAALDWYASLAGGAQRALFTTFAFGMNRRFADVYDHTDDVLRFALMEKKGNGITFRQQAEEVDRIRRRPNVVVSVGARIETNALDRWLRETDRAVAEAHVLYVHTKYLLIDPLGPDPVVIVGSANFSEASTDTNDENMLVIRGNQAVADVYLGEFTRLFNHYAFRESLKFAGATSEAELLRRNHLVPSPAWIDDGYFQPGSARFLKRRYFSGQ